MLTINPFPSIKTTSPFGKDVNPLEELRQKVSNGETKREELTKEQQKKLNDYETVLSAKDQAEMGSFYKKVMDDQRRAESLAKKIAQGKELTPEEQKFLREYSPDLITKAQQARRQGEQLQRELIAAKSDTEQQQLINQGISFSLSLMTNKGDILPSQLQLEAVLSVAKQSANSNIDLSLLLDTQGNLPLYALIGNQKERAITGERINIKI